MEKLIREGALRLLMSESSCDVILSCGGYRLMAHKVILSIASPVLQELLLQEDTVPTVIIFPDISGNTMSLILDYIYSGSINVRSDVLSEFMSVANELKLRVDNESFKVAKYFQESIEENIKPDCKFSINKKEVDIGSIAHEGNHKVQKCVRKMPALLPLTKVKRKNVLRNYITPSPWAPRVTPLLYNPLENHLRGMISRHEKQNIQRNDKNNNLQLQDNIETPPFREISPEDNEKIDSQCSIITSCTAEVSDQTNLVSNSHSNEANGMDTNKQFLNLVDEKKTCVDLAKKNITNTSKQAAHIKINTLKKVVDCVTIDKSLKSSRLRSDTSNSKQTDNKKCFNCEDCGKSFSQLRNFKYHRRSPTKEDTLNVNILDQMKDMTTLLENLSRDVKEMKGEQSANKEEVKLLQEEIKKLRAEQREFKEEIMQLKDINEMAMQEIDYLRKEAKESKERIEGLETKKQGKNIVIQGLRIDTNDPKELKGRTENFIEKNWELQ
ncbi:btb domain transcription factor [Holotrichia oblita]|uniref:Btb domain transcription factor n=1 Tax=Holotrichia oblita TaxID=644536 RepID=A0ACB9TEF4_HOLOL|nr:btb domain transcription factor [Holotrichia oblita]